MSYSIDLNLLLCSVDEDSPVHKSAKRFLIKVLQAEDRCVFDLGKANFPSREILFRMRFWLPCWKPMESGDFTHAIAISENSTTLNRSIRFPVLIITLQTEHTQAHSFLEKGIRQPPKMCGQRHLHPQIEVSRI